MELTEKLRRASNMEEDEQMSALLMAAATTIEDLRDTIKCADAKIDESEWAQKYRDACIMITDQSEEIDRLHSALLRTTGSLGLIIAGAGASAPGHKANLDHAKQVLAEANCASETGDQQPKESHES